MAFRICGTFLKRDHMVVIYFFQIVMKETIAAPLPIIGELILVVCLDLSLPALPHLDQ